MESPATRGTDRRADTAAALYELAAYRELFMRDQIDWFGDNIEVAHCTRRRLGRSAGAMPALPANVRSPHTL